MQQNEATRVRESDALVPSPPAEDATDWQVRIKKAKLARESGRQAREGKPIGVGRTFHGR